MRKGLMTKESIENKLTVLIKRLYEQFLVFAAYFKITIARQRTKKNSTKEE
jgi:hypothetical protein